MTHNWLSAFSAGVVFGLSAGITPGPLFTFVIGQSLKYGVKEGLKTALAPLLSDLPIIWVAWQAAAQLAQLRFGLAGVSLAGSVLLLRFAYESWHTRALRLPTDTEATTLSAPRSLTRGVLLNVLNPHPWLFWLLVGIPFLTRARQQTPWTGVWFVSGFYLLLIGSKVVLVLLLGQARRWLSGQRYVWVMRGLGVCLTIFALLLLRDGWRLLRSAG